MARILIVGCGCRGSGLAEELVSAGHAVRGSTRHDAGLARIEALGAEAVVADPGRLATLTPQLEGVTLLCWLMGTAEGPPEAVAAVNGPRLESMLDAIVDTPVRGVVYEAAGSVEAGVLREGAAIVGRAAARHRMPVATISAEVGDYAAWVSDARAAVEGVLRR
jgi:nucleoside-diphosphate-sugar epimerase